MPSTLYPQPSTLNPQPYTLDPNPSTLKPKPLCFRYQVWEGTWVHILSSSNYRMCSLTIECVLLLGVGGDMGALSVIKQLVARCAPVPL